MRTTLLGQQIAYSEAGSGIPLLLLHAFPVHRALFADIAPSLSQQVRMITLDMPGMGESPTGADVSMERQAALSVALLDHLGIDRAILGGVSMGGYASFAAWRTHHDRIRGLLLANTKPDADTEEAKAARAATAEVAREQGPSAIADAMLPKLVSAHSARARPSAVAALRGMIESARGETIAQYLAALADRTDANELLPQISVPTLAIAGAADQITPASAAREWAARIPDSTYVEIPDAGHLACLEAPAAFTAALTPWLARF